MCVFVIYMCEYALVVAEQLFALCMWWWWRRVFVCVVYVVVVETLCVRVVYMVVVETCLCVRCVSGGGCVDTLCVCALWFSTAEMNWL